MFTELEKPKNISRLSNSEILLGPVLKPNQILEALDEDQYEELVLQWAHYHVTKQYIKVYGVGGAGDKGRDVCAIVNEEKQVWDLYQCKHYSSMLSPAEIYIELGKLIYYTFNKDYSVPRKYYFVSPKGIGPKLLGLIENPEKLKQELKNNWADKCEKGITTKENIKLEGEILKYFDTFNFSIIDWLEPNTFIDQFRQTPFFSRWFGGGLNKTREELPKANKDIEKNELVYIREIFAAYSDYLNRFISSIEDISDKQELLNHFQRQRDSFYIADSLYQFSRDELPYNSNSFEELKDEIFSLIIDIVESDFENGFIRLKEAIKEAKRGSFNNNPLFYEIKVQDKEGICHHLVNDKKIRWVKE